MEIAATKPRTTKSRKIPAALIYERLNGKDLYYKGYREVIKGVKTREEIMGSSSLQAEIIFQLLRILFSSLDLKRYKVYTNEPGLHIDTGNNLSGDILIYENSVLTPDKINKKYSTVPAFIHLEVDVMADMETMDDVEYISNKINRLFAFGTQKVIWVFTTSQRVLVATPNADWVWIDWDKDVEIMNGIFFSVGKFLDEQGIVV
ncbi:hypothetical protein BH10BAC3_BH10BAC3_26040 [soil metagenome]